MNRIKTVEISEGVTWVEIPEADLYMICACPADTVKHLMKRGLIYPISRGGVTFESGPNAILLSDVLVQNGAFSNLAEFPLLQMLYRQGMILPGHPGNTGRKPLLIGSSSQVRSQLRYFHRGNYGLISLDELRLAGLSSAEAKQAMRIKLKFAFGRISPPEGLVDTVILGHESRELPGGVSIRRIRPNVFEIAYAGESVTVDLTLTSNAPYPAPYPLGFQNMGREYFSVTHCGDGDGWDINRPCMAAVITFQGRVFLIDAGPNILYGLTALGIDVGEVEGVFHTHAHDDHFAGLTSLMQADHRIAYYATPLVRASVTKKWAALVSRPEAEFANYFDIRDLRQGRWNEVYGLQVKPVASPHPVETTVFFFRAKSEEGWRSYAHLADIASHRVLKGFVAKDDNEPGITPSHLRKVRRDYLSRADVKKIDAGGGLIHGDAKDFQHDRSGKIILSHRALELSGAEKEIGSGASFGMADVLIRGNQDFLRFKAFQHISSYLPGLSSHEMRLLLNTPMLTINPETILIKRGETHRHVYLVVTGAAEMIEAGQAQGNRLPAGTLVGDISGLAGRPSRATYRAVTFLRALRLPCALLRQVIAANKLDKEFASQRDRRDFFQGTRLFGESLSTAVLGRVAKNASLISFDQGPLALNLLSPGLLVLARGQAELHIAGTPFATLAPGDAVNESQVLFGAPSLYEVTAASPGQAYAIPAKIIRDIPALRWKLYETHKRRMESLIDQRFENVDVFAWNEAYSLGLASIDSDHRELLTRAGMVHKAFVRGLGREEVEKALQYLANYALEHFHREEAELKRYKYPRYAAHKDQHRRLAQEVHQKIADDQGGAETLDFEFMSFIREWIIEHIMTEDLDFGIYLKERGLVQNMDPAAAARSRRFPSGAREI